MRMLFKMVEPPIIKGRSDGLEGRLNSFILKLSIRNATL
jgi:hypothetical protein